MDGTLRQFEKFSRINKIEIIVFLCLGTIISQINRIFFLQSDFFEDFINPHKLDFNIVYLFSYSFSIFLAMIIVLLYIKKTKAIKLRELGFKKTDNILKMLIYSIMAVAIAIILYEVIDVIVKHMPFNMYWGDSNKNYSVVPKNIKEVYLTSIAVLFLVPIAEDIIYRGILVNYLRTKMSIRNTILVAAVFFSIFHLPFYGIGLSIYMFFWTIISCYLYVKLDNIYSCLIFHIINNLMSYIIFPMVA